MKVKLRVWRQKDANTPGGLKEYETPDVNPNMSFLEMLDVVNDELTVKGGEPIAFDHDCREGICGTGPHRGVATCQTYLRSFHDGDDITVEPFRAKPFSVIKDLVVNRQAFDRIMQAGGFISVRTGSGCDANAIPVPKEAAELAMDAAACIGCGACVAACKNGSAMLFVGAKVSQFGLLPQGQPEREQRVLAMVKQMDAEGFGNCTNYYECSAVCPKLISHEFIARMNRDYLKAVLRTAFTPTSTNASAAG